LSPGGAPVYVLQGERVALGPLRTDLADRYARWVNDPEVKDGILNLGLYTPEDEVRFVEQLQAEAARKDPTGAHFTIYDLADAEPVGMTGLFGVSWRHRRAELGINLGERRGQGLGTDAVRLTLRWAFEVLSLHNVLLGYLGHNAGARRCYERAGFREIGRRREAILKHGRLVDEIYMDAIASDHR
jgi:RimJ/RimL family protein N-acetyltransferase